MKNYLKEELSEEEKLTILGIIWNVSRLYKKRYFIQQRKSYDIIDNIDLQTEDEYTFYNLSSETIKLFPFNNEQKCNIVMELDILLKELSLFELIGALTFNEKLVFFLYYIENYKNVEIAFMLGNSEKTIFNRRKSIDSKIKKMKGEL